MGNGGFYSHVNESQGVSAWWKETAQTRVFVLSPSLLLNRHEHQSIKAELLLPIMPIGIVAYALRFRGTTFVETAVDSLRYNKIQFRN